MDQSFSSAPGAPARLRSLLQVKTITSGVRKNGEGNKRVIVTGHPDGLQGGAKRLGASEEGISGASGQGAGAMPRGNGTKGMPQMPEAEKCHKWQGQRVPGAECRTTLLLPLRSKEAPRAFPDRGIFGP